MSEFVPVTFLKSVKPNKMFRAQVQQQAVLLANVDGTIYAVEDMCSHEDASLYNGALKGDCVECPLHGAMFNLKTGEPTHEPATLPIKTFPVKVENNTIYISLD